MRLTRTPLLELVKMLSLYRRKLKPGMIFVTQEHSTVCFEVGVQDLNNHSVMDLSIVPWLRYHTLLLALLTLHSLFRHICEVNRTLYHVTPLVLVQ